MTWNKIMFHVVSPSVQHAVSDGFGQVLRENVRRAGKVADGAGDLEESDFNPLTHRWQRYNDGSSIDSLYLLTVRVKFDEPGCV